MANQYKQKITNNFQTRFDAAPLSGVEFSRMTANPTHLTTFNAGDIVPIYCAEVLPNDTFDMSLDFVIRQNTTLTPTMAQMDVDYYAFFVPNRVVASNWKNVNGENTSGRWVAPDVSLVPLMRNSPNYENGIQVPVGSVADYYGFPTQQAIPLDILMQCNDLKFKGYLEIYNNYFRDQNYSAPIPYSKVLYNGFFEPVNSYIPANAHSTALSVSVSTASADGDYKTGGNVVEALYGEGASVAGSNNGAISMSNRRTSWSALSAPLKANKKHDYFTSVLPSPQKGRDVIISIGDTAPLSQGYANLVNSNTLPAGSAPSSIVNVVYDNSGNSVINQLLGTGAVGQLSAGVPEGIEQPSFSSSDRVRFLLTADLSNITADLASASGLTLSDLRMGAAIQQTFELMARGGTRYREYVKTFFGVEADDPFKDIPSYLGHFRRGLDLYQTAQTSSSVEGGTPQGNLAAFGYTNENGKLFTQTFLEHGYIHVFAVVRQQNVYTSYLAPDNFRLNHLDWYLPTLANISEQPVWSKYINPFNGGSHVFGYQEAWAEYRFEPSRVSGQMRSGINASLDLWSYADEFDSQLIVASDEWLKSNAAEVLDRSLAVTSEVAPQFKAQFVFHVTKQRPMPTYSVPGLDVL